MENSKRGPFTFGCAMQLLPLIIFIYMSFAGYEVGAVTGTLMWVSFLVGLYISNHYIDDGNKVSGASPSNEGVSLSNQKKCKNETTKILFFDTETAGKPQDWDAPASDLENWPRLVQIAWVMSDPNGNKLESESQIIRPDGFEIPSSSQSLHGISTEKAERNGIQIENVLALFKEKVDNSKVIVGHNIEFDVKVLSAEFLRAGIENNLTEKEKKCTMKSSTQYLKIPGKHGYKYPSLEEMYSGLFNKTFEGAHDAQKDVEATAECFFELKRVGVI